MSTQRVSIFEIENKLDIEKEFRRLNEVLSCSRYPIKVGFSGGSFFDSINDKIFPYWPHRDTFLDIYDYLSFIGINKSVRTNERSINEIQFLNFLEFLENISSFTFRYCQNKNLNLLYSSKVTGCISNIQVLLHKMGYKKEYRGGKSYILKENIDVDSIADSVPNNILDALLSYCDFRIENNLQAKRSLLKTIDLYIDANKKSLMKNNGSKSLISDIDFIINRMGINHEIDSKYKNLSEEELLNWYDNAFILSLELLRADKIHSIRAKITELKAEFTSK